MQYIFVRELKVDAVIGVYEEERRRPQPLVFDLEVGLPSRRAFSSDHLGDTIDYCDVVALVKRELAANTCILLERLAQRIAEGIVAELDSPRVRIRVAKTGMVEGVREVGVVLEHEAPRTPSVAALFGERMGAVA